MPRTDLIEIFENPDDKEECFVSHSFEALRQEKVKFVFKQHPDAFITFERVSPFDDKRFQIGDGGNAQTVRGDSLAQSYGYTITWSDQRSKGSGNGGGSVGGSRTGSGK